LLGALGRTSMHVDRLLTRVALGGNWPHLVNI
jgi:hypothetical protein